VRCERSNHDPLRRCVGPAAGDRDTPQANLRRQRNRSGPAPSDVRFDRLLSRLALAPRGQWILKGGAALEFRLSSRARATKDLDVATRAEDDDGSVLRDALIEALSDDADHDWFTFRLGAAKELAPDAAGRRAWRYTVESWLAGKRFTAIRLDVAARSEELVMTQLVELPGALAFAGIPARSIETVSSEQHFAEKAARADSRLR
jgi:hypothetical protein